MNKKQFTDTCQILSNVSTSRIIMNASCRHLGKMEDVNSASSADAFFQQLVIQSTMRALEIWHLQDQSFRAYHTSRKGLWLPTFLPESCAISIVIISNIRTKSTVRMRCVDDMVTHLPLRSLGTVKTELFYADNGGTVRRHVDQGQGDSFERSTD